MVSRLFLCYNYYWLSPTTFVTVTNRKCSLYLNVHYTLSPTINVHITVFPLTLTPDPGPP